MRLSEPAPAVQGSRAAVVRPTPPIEPRPAAPTDRAQPNQVPASAGSARGEPPVVIAAPSERRPAADSASLRVVRPPERAKATPEPTPFDAVLESILYATDRKLAIVDGRIVQPGDVIRGAVIVDITPSSVLLRDATGRPRRLSLGSASERGRH